MLGQLESDGSRKVISYTLKAYQNHVVDEF